MQHFRALDGVRGIAILMVVLFHFGLLGLGWMGVEIFFVLSGFLITNILLQGKEWPLGFYLKRFYWRRTLRIFPLYFGFLFITTAIYLIFRRPVGTGDLLPYLYSYTFNLWLVTADWTQNFFFHYLWSLSFEEQFYLVWPFLVFVIPRRGLIIACICLLLLSPGIRYLFAEYLIEARGSHELVGGMVYYMPFGQLDTFATGGLLALLRLEKRTSNPLRWLGICFGLFVIGGMVNSFILEENMPNYLVTNFGYPISSLANGQHIWGYTLINLMAGSLILVGIHPREGRPHLVRRFLEMPWLTQIGRISYGMYVLHWPLQYFLEKLVDLPFNSALRFFAFFPYMGLLLGLSWLSFRYFESPFLRLKNKRWKTPPGDTNSG